MSKKIIKTTKDNFIKLNDVLNFAIFDIRYSTNDNFTGDIVPYYDANDAYIKKDTALKIIQIEKELKKQDLAIIVYDAYRPLYSAHYFFNQWRNLADNIIAKSKYYPNISKSEIFKNQLLSKWSSHCKGRTLDIGLYDIKKQTVLDMGAEFDYFDDTSATNFYIDKNSKFHQNRMILLEIMQKYNFRNYTKEWWHYTDNDNEEEIYYNFKLGD